MLDSSISTLPYLQYVNTTVPENVDYPAYGINAQSWWEIRWFSSFHMFFLFTVHNSLKMLKVFRIKKHDCKLYCVCVCVSQGRCSDIKPLFLSPTYMQMSLNITVWLVSSLLPLCVSSNDPAVVTDLRPAKQTLHLLCYETTTGNKNLLDVSGPRSDRRD